MKLKFNFLYFSILLDISPLPDKDLPLPDKSKNLFFSLFDFDR
jgi:hypothetical protein